MAEHNVNSSIDERRDNKERDRQSFASQSPTQQGAEITSAIVTTLQPSLHIMATLFNAYGQGLRAMAMAFDDERRRSYEHHDQRRAG